MSLQGKIVFITGASTGIGREAAKRFAKRGAIPVLTARSVDKLHALAEEIRVQFGVTCPVYALDVQDQQQAEAVVHDVLANQGRIDVLVNNAGFGVFKETMEMTMDEVEDMMDVNYFGLVRMTKAVLPSMLERRAGHIVNVSSMAGFFATQTHGCYAATKFAVMGFSEGLRFELNGSGVTLSTVNPGPIETEFWNRADRTQVPTFAKFLSAEEVADTMVRAAEEKKVLYVLPKVGSFAIKIRHLFPRLYDLVMTRFH